MDSAKDRPVTQIAKLAQPIRNSKHLTFQNAPMATCIEEKKKHLQVGKLN